MATSGQTLNDRINAARYALAGQGLARCVCKATTEEVIGPKKKHLDYLLACTHEPNVSIPQLANLLIERTNHIYWVVVFKALVTVHHLMSYGNERFTQYLASSNYSFELSTFLDKTAARDFSMSTFIRRYSRYINEKALSYRLLAFDFCKVKRGNEGVLRLMPIDRLLKTLPILQNQLDALLEFDCSANDLNNGVINACFMLLFRDLIGLFACHNDGIINLLNKYFTLNRKMCREAFDLYKKFLVRMDKVSEFLRVAEVVGIDKDEIPDLRRAPSSLIDALEQHLQNIESNKKILKQQQTSSSSTTSNGKTGSGLQVLANLTPPSSRRSSSPQGTAMAAQGSMGDDFALSTSFKDDEVRKALEEEARVLSQYGSIEASGVKSKCKSSSISNGGANSPKFATAAAATIPKSIDDIFGDADSFATTTTTSKNNNKSGGNLLSEQVGGGAPAFDNLSTSSSSTTTTTNTAKQRPDVDSIKSAILSATSTLEKSSAINSSSDSSRPTVKKASDELFSLLDSGSTTTSNSTTSALASSNPLDGSNSTNNKPLSPFATPSATTAFDMLTATSTITTNGHLPGPPTLKPGNPFPEVAGDLSSAFRAAPFASGALPTPQVVAQPTIGNSAVFKSGVSTANYTNLGGLEGFGDLLQPMSTTSKTNTSNSTNNGGTSKPSFNSASGLSSTGLFKGDLDSTLANLAQNLTFDAINKTKK